MNQGLGRTYGDRDEVLLAVTFSNDVASDVDDILICGRDLSGSCEQHTCLHLQ